MYGTFRLDMDKRLDLAPMATHPDLPLGPLTPPLRTRQRHHVPGPPRP
ncbi:hypothetical protein ACR6C2_04605 [Streptomyces sp. INA 01156]